MFFYTLSENLTNLYKQNINLTGNSTHLFVNFNLKEKCLEKLLKKYQKRRQKAEKKSNYNFIYTAIIFEKSIKNILL